MAQKRTTMAQDALAPAPDQPEQTPATDPATGQAPAAKPKPKAKAKPKKRKPKPKAKKEPGAKPLGVRRVSEDERLRTMNDASGRPTKLTSPVINKMLAAIRAGAYVETAAAVAGIHKSTFYDWLRTGAREADLRSAGGKPNENLTPLVIFSDAIEKALAESELRDVLLIASAARREWQAAAWRLERKFPKRWGRRTAVEMEGNLNVTNEPEIQKALETEEGREALEAMFRAINGGTGSGVAEESE